MTDFPTLNGDDVVRNHMWQTQIVPYLGVAAYSWLMYDYFLVINDEIDLIWLKKWSWSKLFYIWTRYYGILVQHVDLITLTGRWSKSYCHAYFWFIGYGGCVLLYTVQMTLMFRLYAMYDKNRWIFWINISLFTAEIISMMVLFGVALPHMKSDATPPLITGCWGKGLPRYLFGVWIPGLTFEAWLSALVLYKSHQKSKEIFHHPSFKKGSAGNLFALLVRDALIWFIAIAVFLFWNSVSWTFSPPGMTEMGVPLFHSCATIGGSRLLLNIRAACYPEEARRHGIERTNGPTTAAGTADFKFHHPEKRGVLRTEDWMITTATGTGFGFVGQDISYFTNGRDTIMTRDDGVRSFPAPNADISIQPQRPEVTWGRTEYEGGYPHRERTSDVERPW